MITHINLLVIGYFYFCTNKSVQLCSFPKEIQLKTIFKFRYRCEISLSYKKSDQGHAIKNFINISLLNV